MKQIRLLWLTLSMAAILSLGSSITCGAQTSSSTTHVTSLSDLAELAIKYGKDIEMVPEFCDAWFLPRPCTFKQLVMNVSHPDQGTALVCRREKDGQLTVIIMAKLHNHGTYFFKTSPKGELQKVIYAEKGEKYRADFMTAIKDFHNIKQFWEFRYTKLQQVLPSWDKKENLATLLAVSADVFPTIEPPEMEKPKPLKPTTKRTPFKRL